MWDIVLPTWTSELFLLVQETDDPLRCLLVGPPVGDGGPQLRVSFRSLAVVRQDDLVAGQPQAPQGQDGFLRRPRELV